MTTKLGEGRILTQPGPWNGALVNAKQVRILGFEAAKVEKTKGLFVDFVTRARRAQPTRIRVPVCHVTGFVFQNEGVEVTGRKIHPALVGETHIGKIDHRFAEKSLAPPVKKCGAIRI